ncbi:MAG: 50S ribosomal protein L1 [Puniceicoccales bacterium]|jgi:large subunit ribosomal protein L1|nr:50S ribosomal protein L1 [Puniceicoccales bacterium]
MKNRSKRHLKSQEVADLSRSFGIEEAVVLLNKMSRAKFDETVEISIHFGVDPKQSDQMVRGTVKLPHGSGKNVKVLAFTESPETAIKAGADFAGLEDMIEKVSSGWLEFDVAVATTLAMKQVRNVAKILGPRGLMPNPKSGTVSDDIVSAITDVKAGRVEFKMDKTANAGIVVGKRSFEYDKIIENIKAVIASVNEARPANFRGTFIKGMSISGTMTPGLRIVPTEYNKEVA